jgi:hypothetical protein
MRGGFRETGGEVLRGSEGEKGIGQSRRCVGCVGCTARRDQGRTVLRFLGLQSD